MSYLMDYGDDWPPREPPRRPRACSRTSRRRRLSTSIQLGFITGLVLLAIITIISDQFRTPGVVNFPMVGHPPTPAAARSHP